MVIEPFVRMGPPPRSLPRKRMTASWSGSPRGQLNTRLRRDLRALGGLPSDCWRTARPASPNRRTERRDHQRTPCGMAIPFRNVTENRACHEVANQLASTPSATPNDRLDIARPSRGRPTASQDPLPSANGQTDQSSALERHRRRLVELQAEYVAWHDALPDSLRDSATAEALQAIVDLDLDALIAIVPPRGCGRD